MVAPVVASVIVTLTVFLMLPPLGEITGADTLGLGVGVGGGVAVGDGIGVGVGDGVGAGVGVAGGLPFLPTVNDAAATALSL